MWAFQAKSLLLKKYILLIFVYVPITDAQNTEMALSKI